MENYAKVVLYAYPLLKTVGKDYQDHIRNKALLSYDSKMSAERLAEYLAQEILHMRLLVDLKNKVERALKKLDTSDRAAIVKKYFGVRSASKCDVNSSTSSGQACNRKQLARLQNRAVDKIAELFALEGLTAEFYKKYYREMDIFKKVRRCLERKRRRAVLQNTSEDQGSVS